MTIEATTSTQGRRGRRLLLFGLGVVLMACASVPPAGAQTEDPIEARRDHDVSWGHPDPASVARFVILASPTSHVESARQIEVGKPNGVPAPGLTVYSARAAFLDDELISVIAIGTNGLPSEPSRWTGLPATRPGQPLVVDP